MSHLNLAPKLTARDIAGRGAIPDFCSELANTWLAAARKEGIHAERKHLSTQA